VAAKVRVTRGPVSFGGWKGQLEIVGNVLHIVGDDPANYLDIDCAQVKRYSFNSNNGLWALRMRDGRKLYVQTSGFLLSADRSEAGKAATRSISSLLKENAAHGFQI
jgi:hypothetical protein